MAKPPKKLTTVSYTVLGLLRLKPHSPYELAGQIKRLSVFWSSAESVVYEEPKNLVAHGLARASTEKAGKRSRTVYTITAGGKRELSRWFQEPTADPQIQFEAMLKVLFADASTKDDVLRAIETIRAWAEQTRANGEAISADYVDGEPPYPDRAHIVALTMAYQVSFVDAVRTWADWATTEVESWDGTGPQRDLDPVVFERVVKGAHPIAE